MAQEGLFELWTLLVAGACVYFCSIIIGQMSPVPHAISAASVPEDPHVHSLRRTLNVRENPADQEAEHLQQAQNHQLIEVNPGNVTVAGQTLGRNPAVKPANVSRKVNLEKYPVVINQPYLCHQAENDGLGEVEEVEGTVRMPQYYNMSVYLLVIIHSHPAHKRRRNAIRETWGRIVHTFDPERQVVILYLLGLPHDYDEYQSVKREAGLYRDTVVYDFTDEYRNLSIKSLLGLYWASTNCPNAKYIIKADDDVYLNVPFFLEELHKQRTENLILGSLNARSPVRRYGQWRVDYRDYPYQLFPPYCSGCTYAMSGDLPRRLVAVTQGNHSPPMIPVEDVYVTGLLAERLGVRCKHHEQFPTWITVPSAHYVQRFLTSRILGLHGVDWIRMHTMWHMIHKCANCTKDISQVQQWLNWLMDIDPNYR